MLTGILHGGQGIQEYRIRGELLTNEIVYGLHITCESFKFVIVIDTITNTINYGCTSLTACLCQILIILHGGSHGFQQSLKVLSSLVGQF